MKKSFVKIFAALISASMLLAACSSAPTNQSSNKTEDNKQQTTQEESKIKVVTSMYPMYDFAKKVAGDKADVENIIPAGTEAHGWEPSASDIAKLEGADVFIYNGAGMEMWVDDVLKSLSNKKLVAVETSKGIELLENHEDDHDHDHDGKKEHDHDHDGKKDDKDSKETHKDDTHKAEDKDHDHEDKDHDHDEHHHHGKYDPHVWLSIKNAKKQMESIKDALVKADEKNKAYYEENYEKYAKEFDALDAKYTQTLKPYSGKNIVVAHEAFGYLGKDYGISQLGIEGVFEDSEPDPAKMKEVIEFVKENKVKVIFFETLTSDKVSKTIASETGATTDVLNPVEGLTKEEMDSGKDYLSIMEENLKALEKSFK